MTTIAFKDGVMAGDTQENWGGTPIPAKKVYKLGGALFGTSGSAEFAYVFYDWLKSGLPRREPYGEENVCALVYANGLFYFLERFIPIPVNKPFWAIGSGAEYALAAMELGKSAEDAVRTAIELDINSGGEVYSVKYPLKNGL